MYLNVHTIKSEDKQTTTKYLHFIKSNFVEISRLFVLIYSNQDTNAKKYKA